MIVLFELLSIPTYVPLAGSAQYPLRAWPVWYRIPTRVPSRCTWLSRRPRTDVAALLIGRGGTASGRGVYLHLARLRLEDAAERGVGRHGGEVALGRELYILDVRLVTELVRAAHGRHGGVSNMGAPACERFPAA